MLAYILDASALIRYIDDEAGAARVEEVLGAFVSKKAHICIPTTQWGEIAGNLRKRVSVREQQRILSSLLPVDAEIVPLSAERAVRAAEIKVDRRIGYADAILVELALSVVDGVLLTADYDFKEVADLTTIEFLPLS